MTESALTLGQQWTVSLDELASHARASALVLFAPTGCDRSSRLSFVLGKSCGARLAFFFSAYITPAQPIVEAAEAARRAESLEQAGWSIAPVQQPESREFISLLRVALSQLEDGARVLVDITGFPRAALAIVVRIVAEQGSRVTWIYSEPLRYLDGGETEFAIGQASVGPITGFAGTSVLSDEGALIVLCGYDTSALRAVAEYRKGASPRHLIVPFPSLQAQMYQEGIIKLHRARESLGVKATERGNAHRVPAFDAFGVVEALDDLCNSFATRPVSVAPLSTKAQTLGVLLWWTRLSEERRGLVALLSPRYRHLRPRVSEGLGRIWTYRLFSD